MAVWVLAEGDGAGIPGAALECLADARELAARLGGPVWALLLGDRVPEERIPPLAHHGADRVLCIEHESLEPYTTDAWLAALTDLCARHRPALLLAAHTAVGRDLAPRLAARLGAACASDCVELRVGEGGGVEATRHAFADRVSQTLALEGPAPAIATLRPGVAGLPRPDRNRTAEVERVRPQLHPAAPRVRVLGTIPADPRTIDIREAERIVAAGRGVGGPDGIALCQELADALGAALAGSRVAVDLGWLPWERQVGQSGRTVAPRLYIACGISGASQHLAGIRDARTVVAINQDRSAPIFGVAHLGVVGDAGRIIPALTRRIKAAVR